MGDSAERGKQAQGLPWAVASQTSHSIDLDALLDAQPLGTSHIIIGVVLTLIMLIDGYTLSIVSVLLPAIARSMHTAAAALTAVVVAQQAGLLVGLTAIGPLSDRFGRRRMLLTCLCVVAVLISLVSQVRAPLPLAGLCFASAMFSSAIIPNSVTLALESAPKRLQASAIALVFTGYSCGPLIGASVLVQISESLDWRMGFYIGVLLIVATVPLAWLLLPESVRYLVARDAGDPRIVETLKRMHRQLTFNGSERFHRSESARGRGRGSPWPDIRDEEAKLLLLFCGAYFMSFIANRITSSWQTTVLIEGAHVPVARVGLIVFLSTLGGIVASLLTGVFMDRLGAARVLVVFFLLTAAISISLAVIELNSPLAILLYVAYAFAISIGLVGLNAFAALSFPASMRVTAVAWASGVGWFGGIIGPWVGGLMLSASATRAANIYWVAALPAALAAVALYGISRRLQLRHTISA